MIFYGTLWKVSPVVEKGTAVLYQVLPGTRFMGLSTVGAEGSLSAWRWSEELGASKGHLSSPLALEFLTASVKACQTQELYWCWLGCSWLWEHSNTAFSSLEHSGGSDNLGTINAAIVAVVIIVRQVCGL